MTSTNELIEKFHSTIPFDDKYYATDFDIINYVSAGSFANVYKAKKVCNDTNFPQYVALKMISQSKIEQRKHLVKFETEVKILNSVTNDYFVGYYGSFIDEDELVIILDYHSNTLFQLLRGSVYFGEDAARYLTAQVIMGIDYLHSSLIAYRDLKPENILITLDWKIKLTDFSFSKILSDRSYTSLGTVEYMAPEIIMNTGYGLGVDWWAFGVMLYELCAGHTPFRDDYLLSIMKRISKGKFRFPPHFSMEVKDLIQNLLTVDVSKRIGCLKNKSDDIQHHKWFKNNINWTEFNCTTLPKELCNYDFDRNNVEGQSCSDYI